MKVLVKVTDEIIDKSYVRLENEGRRCLECPVAMAISVALGKPITVNGTEWRFVLSDRYHELPSSAKRFVHKFDSGSCDGVDPFEFEIEVPDA